MCDYKYDFPAQPCIIDSLVYFTDDAFRRRPAQLNIVQANFTRL